MPYRPEMASSEQHIPGFSTWNCDKLAYPILLSIPHSGRVYPDFVLENLRIAPSDLLRLEDRYADRLASAAISAGIPTICAQIARACIDLNRDISDIDPDMVVGATGPTNRLGSAKMRGGLGLIPRRLAVCGEIWRKPLAQSEVEDRINRYHKPYHSEISKILQAISERHGIAILVDLHSMPPLTTRDNREPNIVIGDRFGQSASSIYAELLTSRLGEMQYSVALNHPYPGDYVLRQHGAPHRNIHAIQIEVDRSLYLDSTLREPVSNLAKVSADISEILFALVDQAKGSGLPMAAE